MPAAPEPAQPRASRGRRPETLRGSRAQIELLAEVAESCVGSAHRDWLDQVKRLPASPGTKAGARVGGTHPGAGFRLWWVLMLAGAIAVVWAGAGTLPPKHYVTATFAGQLEWTRPVALPAAFLMLLAAMLPVPREVRLNHNASATAILVIVFTSLPLIMLGVRSLRAPSTVPVPDIWPWVAGMVLSLTGGVVVLLRTTRSTAHASTATSHERLRLGRRLVRSAPTGVQSTLVTKAWVQHLSEMDDLSATAREQALRIGPFTYLVSARLHHLH